MRNTTSPIRSTRHLASASALATSFVLIALSQPAWAAQAGDTAAEKEKAQAKEISGDIVVTARKREEDILEVPVTISALTAEQLEQRGVKSISDALQAAPGVNVADASAGGGHADRSFQQINLRGFTPTSALAVTTSMFIDGVPVSSPTAITAIADPARIEVLKGPQSAYFGRNTFAGAVNVVTKEPTGEWGGDATLMYGTRKNFQIKGALEGSIVGDALTFRVTGNHWEKGGTWTNAATGEKLGRQSSTNGTLLIVAKPTDSLTIKLFGMLDTDDDGPGAQTRLLAYDVDGGDQTFVSQSNCTVNGNPTFCGTIKGLVNPVAAMTFNSAWIKDLLATKSADRLVGPDNAVEGYGLLRHTQHFHATMDYELNSQLSLSLLGGYNHEEWSQLTELSLLDMTGVANSAAAYSTNSLDPDYYSYPYYIDAIQKDYSLEGRLNYDFGALHGVVGASWLDARQQTGGGYFSYGSAGDPLFFTGGENRARTFGGFFGATWDMTETLSASVEGRYQIDTITAYNTDGSELLTQSYRNFLPRAIVNFQYTPDHMVYASWAKGVNPGAFNSALLGYSESVQQQLADAGLKLAVDPEKVTNYELGAKGRLFGGAMVYQVAAYYDQWRNQMNTIYQAVYNDESNSYDFVGGTANTGSVDLWGLEIQTITNPADFITIEAAGALNDSSIKSYVNPTLTTLTGTDDFTGNEMPLASKWSANVGVTFHGDLDETTTWFWRTDWNFKSGVWSSAANLARTADRHVFNTRVGIDAGSVSVQFFLNNVLNDKTFTGLYDNWTIDPASSHYAAYSALHAGLPELRTFGMQIGKKF
ncbi:TonB-dependent receptor [Novosphingobium profundi]|uniref:TonB-dependent receptor n=1 Tax=Novosphingobium profundi TaxID=1774954 RepID=UPI001BD9CBF9|nr:TonB-dependent receptor [Novosphingobium profundi]MBT0670987.1 TonB-dependent receptor [Novosphingobium profundi]